MFDNLNKTPVRNAVDFYHLLVQTKVPERRRHTAYGACPPRPTAVNG